MRPPTKTRSVATKTRRPTKREIRRKAEAYQGVELLIWKQVHGFVRKYGEAFGTREEIFSHAAVAFVRAYDTFDPDKGAFTTHVQHKIYRTLQGVVEDGCKAKAREAGRKAVTGDIVARVSWWRAFLADLSDDARLVAGLAVDGPKGLRKILDDNEGEGPFGVRLMLRAYLDGLGWPRERINATFREVREALR